MPACCQWLLRAIYEQTTYLGESNTSMGACVVTSIGHSLACPQYLFFVVPLGIDVHLKLAPQLVALVANDILQGAWAKMVYLVTKCELSTVVSLSLRSLYWLATSAVQCLLMSNSNSFLLGDPAWFLLLIWMAAGGTSGLGFLTNGSGAIGCGTKRVIHHGTPRDGSYWAREDIWLLEITLHGCSSGTRTRKGQGSGLFCGWLAW